MHILSQEMSVPEFGEEGRVYDLQANFIAMSLREHSWLEACPDTLALNQLCSHQVRGGFMLGVSCLEIPHGHGYCHGT